jgi:hypothetical protein
VLPPLGALVTPYDCDVILYADDPLGAFAPDFNASKPTGGTEVHMVQLAEGLAAEGFAVVAYSAIPARETHGAEYRPPSSGITPRCRALVTAGLSQVPNWIRTDRHAILWTHDPPHNVPFLVERGLRWNKYVCVSEWQRARFPFGWDTAAIPSMIDPWIYDLPPVPKDPKKFVCVSAWWKGTMDTLVAWEMNHPAGATLYVGSPYSHPPSARAMVERTPGCRWVELPSPRAVVEMLRDAAGVYRVCAAPETFGVTDAIAQILGCRVHVFCNGDPGALPDTLGAWHYVTNNLDQFHREFLASYHAPPLEPSFDHQRHLRDYRPKKIIPQWMKLLGLEKRL